MSSYKYSWKHNRFDAPSNINQLPPDAIQATWQIVDDVKRNGGLKIPAKFKYGLIGLAAVIGVLMIILVLLVQVVRSLVYLVPILFFLLIGLLLSFFAYYNRRMRFKRAKSYFNSKRAEYNQQLAKFGLDVTENFKMKRNWFRMKSKHTGRKRGKYSIKGGIVFSDRAEGRSFNNSMMSGPMNPYSGAPNASFQSFITPRQQNYYDTPAYPNQGQNMGYFGPQPPYGQQPYGQPGGGYPGGNNGYG